MDLERIHRTLDNNEVVTFGNTSKVLNCGIIEEEKHHNFCGIVLLTASHTYFIYFEANKFITWTLFHI